MDKSNKDERERALEDALLPCPFCGKAADVEITEAPGERPFYNVACGSCNALLDADYWSEEEAIAAWNTRAEAKRADELEKENERLKELARQGDSDKLQRDALLRVCDDRTARIEKLEVVLRDANALIWQRLNDADPQVDKLHLQISEALKAPPEKGQP